MKRIYPIILIVLAVLLTSVAFAAEKQPGQVLSPMSPAIRKRTEAQRLNLH